MMKSQRTLALVLPELLPGVNTKKIHQTLPSQPSQISILSSFESEERQRDIISQLDSINSQLKILRVFPLIIENTILAQP